MALQELLFNISTHFNMLAYVNHPYNRGCFKSHIFSTCSFFSLRPLKKRPYKPEENGKAATDTVY